MASAVPQFLNDLPLLCELTESEVERISRAAVRRRLSSDLLVQRAGEPASFLGFVLSGRGREILTGEGGAAAVRYLRGGDVICEYSLFCRAGAPTSVELHRGTELLMIGAEALHSLLNDSPRLNGSLARIVAERETELRRRLQLLLFTRGEERIFGYFQLLAQERSTDPQGGLALDLTHEQIAADCGLRRETVSRLLARLRESGRVTRTQHGWRVRPPKDAGR